MVIRNHKRQVRKTKYDSEKAHWSDNQKLEAVTTYLMIGKWPAVSAATGIPIDTLRHWKMQPWWRDFENDIRRANNIEVSGKLQKIISKSADIVMDRLDNGEFIFDTKTGEIKRRPVSAKVTADILSKSIDKDILLQKLEIKDEVKEEQILDRLNSIQIFLRQNVRQKAIVLSNEEINDDVQDHSNSPASE